MLVWQLDVDWKEHIRTYGYPAVFILTLVTSATIIFPLPGDVALFAAPGIMDLSWLGVFLLGLVASIGAGIGELTGYYAGRWGRAAVTGKQMKDYEKTAKRMKRYGGLAIFVFAVTPLPFDVVGIAAGTLRFPVGEFFICCWAGRLVRSLVTVYAGWYGWESIKQMFF
ncbi:MAG: VTT domain-containing protein [Dehalococcoidia bacterium]